MNLEEVKNTITIKEFPNFTENKTMFLAELRVESSLFATDDLLKSCPDAKARIHKELQERILRVLYLDRSRLMAKALVELFREWRDVDFLKAQKLRDQLLNAAYRSVPDETQINPI